MGDADGESPDEPGGPIASSIATLPFPALELDGSGIIVRANEAATLRFAPFVAHVVGMSMRSLVIDVERFTTLLALVAEGRRSAAEVELRGDERTATISEVTVTPRATGTRGSGAIVEIRDVFRRRRSGRAARVRRPTSDHLPSGSPRTLHQAYRSALETGCRLLGARAGAIYLFEAGGFVDAIGDAIDVDHAIAAASDQPAFAEPGGIERWIGRPVRAFGSIVGSAVFAGRSRPVGAGDRDVLDLVAAVAGIAFESETSHQRHERALASDEVTQLPNRAALLEELSLDIREAGARGDRFAVVMVGLDHFKSVNATVGQDAGDAVLWEVGNRLASRVRAGDAIARLGGDEFTILLGGNPTRVEAAIVADRLRATVSSMLRDRGQTLTASLGVAMFPDDGREPAGLLKCAEIAMDCAKQRGRDRAEFYSDTVGVARLATIRLKSELREAIAKGQFEMYYQPQHDTYSGELFAVEALIRWNHPRRGLLTPGVFIPEAEQGDEIVEIGDFVRRQVCRDLKLLRSSVAPDLRVSMNVSGRDFREPNLAEKLVSAAEDALVLPSALELEITETIAMGDVTLTTRVLDELHELGFVLALDDFGTGYSSLNYLRAFPVHALKIDRSFVTDLPIDQGCMTIVKAVIAMAHALGMEVVAEGVETSEQLRFLRVEQCDRWQGYLYAPALRLSELQAYIEHGPYWARPTFRLSAEEESFSAEAPPAFRPSRRDTL